MDIENIISQYLCEHAIDEMSVCPASLQSGVVTIGAMDNIDHNSSATSATGLLHDTAISIT